MTKKVLITGAQGYLGSRLTDYFQEHGIECTGADIGYFQYGVLHPPRAVRCLNKSAADLCEGDIEGHDVVLQLAGISNDPFGGLEPSLVYDPTRSYALKIAKMCKTLGVRYIFPSSCSVYGIGDSDLTEESPTNPQTGYSLNKLQIEKDLAELADSNFSPIALRLATVFGLSPRLRFDLVINMLCGMAITEAKVVLNSNGEAWRPHVYIEDVCEAFRCCVEWNYSEPTLMVLNVGRNDNNFRILDIAQLIQTKVRGCRLEYLSSNASDDSTKLVRDLKVQDGVDKRTYRVNFEKIQSVLPSFKANWDLNRGIDKLLDDLQFWNVDSAKFRQRDFYRLQQLDFLSKTGCLNGIYCQK